jgi:hypothetical protein
MQHTGQEYIGRVTGIRTPLMTGAMLIMMSIADSLRNILPQRTLSMINEQPNIIFKINKSSSIVST